MRLGMWSHHTNSLFNLQGTDPISLFIVSNKNIWFKLPKSRSKGCRKTLKRVQKKANAEKSTKLATPLQQERPIFKEGSTGSRGWTILALALLKGFSAVLKHGQDIRDARGHSSWSFEDALIGNRQLRFAQRSYFGPGLQSGVCRRSGNTNPREESVS